MLLEKIMENGIRQKRRNMEKENVAAVRLRRITPALNEAFPNLTTRA